MSAREFFHRVALYLYAILFDYCYVVGLFVLHVADGLGRFSSVLVRRAERAAARGAVSAARRLGQGLRQVFLRLRRWGQGAAEAGVALRAAAQQLRRRNVRVAGRFLLRAVSAAGAAARPVARTALNWALPALAALVFWNVLQGESQTRYALRVSYGSQETGFSNFGYIADESVYDRAVAEVLQKMKGVDAALPQDLSARFTLEPVPAWQALLDPYTLSDRLIAASNSDTVTAYGLYVDGAFIDATRDKDALLDLLTLMQDRFKTGDATETVSFIKPVALREGLYPVSRVRNLSEIYRKIGREVRGEFTYKAQAGDSPSAIAARFEVPQSQIVANNPGILESLLVGQEVLISRAEPFLSVKITRVETYEESVPYATEVVEDSTLLKDQRKTLRDGQSGLDRVKAAVTYINDIEADRDVISRQRLVDPVPAQISVGTKMFLQNYGGGRVTANFINPVPGLRYVSNGFYGYYNHGGVDLAANYGTPIYASAPGTVTYSGYTATGYGHHIIINHGDGIQTLYAHMSSRVSRVGDRVDQGQVIGYVGSTGNSTGNHCHFEIRINGTRVDPMGYMG